MRFTVQIVEPTRTIFMERTERLTDAARAAKNIADGRGSSDRIWIWDRLNGRSYNAAEWMPHVS